MRADGVRHVDGHVAVALCTHCRPMMLGNHKVS